MYCPQCGQQQISEIVRFCSKCGLPLDGVIQVLENRGVLPVYHAVDGAKEISARRRGVRQGGILFLTGVLVVPILGVLDSFARNSSLLDIFVAIAAILCFVGGPLRMIYAALFEEGAATRPAASSSYLAPSVPLQSGMRGRGAEALPPAPANPATGWRSRPNTAELVRPPSITENTTRLLDKDEPRDR
jgi:zinc-ribbon domain